MDNPSRAILEVDDPPISVPELNYDPIACETKLFTKSELIQYCGEVCRGQQRAYKIIENRAKYFKVNCYAAPKSKFIGYPGICQFHIFAKPFVDSHGNNTDKWTLYRTNESHTCTQADAKRRAHDGRVLMAMSHSLHDFIPNELTRTGANRQVSAIARVSNSIEMKRGQALNVLQKMQNNAVPVHIGQYMLLESYMAILKKADVHGSFDMEVNECMWKDADEHSDEWMQMDRLYVAFSFAKRVWAKNSCNVLVADGTFTTSGVFKHIILLAVTKDGNNNLVLLAYCVCACENVSNWMYFLDHLIRDFPQMNVFMSDYDKGVEAACFQQKLADNDIQFSRCVRHMIGNCALTLKHKISDKTKSFIYGMAKGRTEEIYDHYLAKLKVADPQVADWFNAHKDLFAGHVFLKYGFPRGGNVLNNMAEQFNSIIQELRGRPILDLMIGLNAYQMCQFSLRSEQAIVWEKKSMSITPYAYGLHLKTVTAASKKTYVPHPKSPCGHIYSGVVHSDTDGVCTGTVFVSVNGTTGRQQCPCYYFEEFGMPCRDTWKAILDCEGDKEEEYQLSKWYAHVFSVRAYKDAYTFTLPNISTDGRLSMSSILPPEARNNRGRPKKMRYESTSDNPKRCHSCGNFGHTHATCQTPSTKVRVLHYFDKAFKYARKTTETISLN